MALGRLGGRPDRAGCDAGAGAGRVDRGAQSGGHPPLAAGAPTRPDGARQTWPAITRIRPHKRHCEARGEAVEVLPGASSLPEGQEVVLFTSSDLKNLDRERRAEVDLQMPSFGNPANLTFTRPTCRRHRKPGSPFPLRFRPSPHESTCTIQPEHNQAHTAAVPQNRPPPPASSCGDESTGSSISPTHQLKRTCC